MGASNSASGFDTDAGWALLLLLLTDDENKAPFAKGLDGSMEVAASSEKLSMAVGGSGTEPESEGYGVWTAWPALLASGRAEELSRGKVALSPPC